MDRLQAMRVYVRVVEAKGFSKAAVELNLSPASVTTIVQKLETALGVQLLRRTTRQLNLTDHGKTYFEMCLRTLAHLEELESGFRSVSQEPKVRLCVEIPGWIAHVILLPALDEFLDRFAQLDLLIAGKEKGIHRLRHGIDCAIRIGAIQEPNLTTQEIGSLQLITCAAPSYLARHGEPKVIEDLTRHRMVGVSCEQSGRPEDWVFSVDGKLVTFPPLRRFTVDEWEIQTSSGLLGHGVIQSYDRLVQPYLRSGRLREVLAHLKAPPEPVSLIYPTGLVKPHTREFVEWIIDLFERPAAHAIFFKNKCARVPIVKKPSSRDRLDAGR